MENSTSYTLEELAQETGFDVRTIRNFIEQGLLRGPTTLGRYARYSERHLVRLLAIKALKEKQGLRLTDTRQTLLCMSEIEIAQLAETVRTRKDDNAVSALDYLKSLNMQGFSPQKDPSFARTEKPNRAAREIAEQQSISASDLQFESGSHTPLSSRQMPSSEILHRFQITPDVELTVRGQLSDQQMTRMKNVANRLRDYLIGGQNE